MENKAKAVKEDETLAKPSNGTNYISHLPSKIVTEILSQLPFKTIFSCRFVCKKWFHLFKDPTFTQLYRTRANPNLIILQPKIKDHLLYLVHLDNKNHVRNSSATVNFATHLGIECYVEHSMVDSCNGLILLREVYGDFVKLDRLFVCNLITGEFVMVRLDNNLTSSVVCPPLGFCPKTQVYEVVLLSKEYGVEVSKHTPTLVYALGVKGNGVWKRVNVGDDVHGDTTKNVFLNGIIHWDVISPHVTQFICSFDVENKCFRMVPPPLEMEQFMWLKLGTNLGVLGGCLAIGEDPSNDRWCFHIWVMKDYGVQASWIKAYNIEFAVRKPRCFEPISQILGLWHNGDILLSKTRI